MPRKIFKDSFDVLIPARGGSKGIPKKNLHLLNGKKLIEYTFEFALNFFPNSNIYLSTDSEEIIEVAKSYKISIPFKRPAKFASDNAPMASVITHFLENVNNRERHLILLDPTSPIRNSMHFEKALDTILRTDFNLDGVISISEPSFNPVWTGVKLLENETLELFFHEAVNYTSRQQLEKFYRINGNFYIWHKNFLRYFDIDWLKKGKYLGVKIDDVTAFSIDTIEELVFLEKLLQKRIFNENGIA